MTVLGESRAAPGAQRFCSEFPAIQNKATLIKLPRCTEGQQREIYKMTWPEINMPAPKIAHLGQICTHLTENAADLARRVLTSVCGARLQLNFQSRRGQRRFLSFLTKTAPPAPPQK